MRPCSKCRCSVTRPHVWCGRRGLQDTMPRMFQKHCSKQHVVRPCGYKIHNVSFTAPFPHPELFCIQAGGWLRNVEEILKGRRTSCERYEERFLSMEDYICPSGQSHLRRPGSVAAVPDIIHEVAQPGSALGCEGVK